VGETSYRVANLLEVVSNVSERVFMFGVENDISDGVGSVSFNCSEGVTQSGLTVSGSDTSYFNLSINYSSPGEKRFGCSVLSGDGNDLGFVEFEILGLVIENYDSVLNVSLLSVSFDVRNNFGLLQVNISLGSDSYYFSNLSSLSNGDRVTVSRDINLSSDGVKTVNVDVFSGNDSDSFSQVFTIVGAEISDYNRFVDEYTSQFITFNLLNNWVSGNVSWNVSDPSLANFTFLDTDDSLLFVAWHNYSSQGWQYPTINTEISSYVDAVKDQFDNRPVEITNLETLFEGDNVVHEILVENHLGLSQSVSWRFDTGEENISSNSTVSVTESVFIFIESNYSEKGVFDTAVFVNSSSFNDSEKGVVLQ
jgi:hypothetical protein